MKLLNPGPVNLTDHVRAALQRDDICHREPEFGELQDRIRARILEVYNLDSREFVVILLTGSGTAAVEAMAGTLVLASGAAVIGSNGDYGERLEAILVANGKLAYVARSRWEDPLDITGIAELLAAHPEVTHLLAVHLETTSGRLNDVPALAALCRGRNVKLLLDCVSSFGGEEIDFEGWELEACAATANKCLHGVPGVAFVIVRRATIGQGRSGATGIYLDLLRHYRAQERGAPLFTPAIHACYALDAALEELLDFGGWTGRRAHYRCLTRRLVEGFDPQGVVPVLGEDVSSSAITTLSVPRPIDASMLRQHLKTRGFVTYPGEALVRSNSIRISVMGDVTSSDIDRLHALCADYIRNHSAYPGRRHEG